MAVTAEGRPHPQHKTEMESVTGADTESKEKHLINSAVRISTRTMICY